MGYLKIPWATSIFHQVALLATMCFCLISTPEYGDGLYRTELFVCQPTDSILAQVSRKQSLRAPSALMSQSVA